MDKIIKNIIIFYFVKKFWNLKLFSELLFYIDECKLKIDNDLDRKLYNIIDYSSNNKLNNWIKGEKENEEKKLLFL